MKELDYLAETSGISTAEARLAVRLLVHDARKEKLKRMPKGNPFKGVECYSCGIALPLVNPDCDTCKRRTRQRHYDKKPRRERKSLNLKRVSEMTPEEHERAKARWREKGRKRRERNEQQWNEAIAKRTGGTG